MLSLLNAFAPIAKPLRSHIVRNLSISSHSAMGRVSEIQTVKDLYDQEKLGKASETAFKPDSSSNERVSIMIGDITKLDVSMIVNAANNSLLGGGGVDGAIHRAAGHQLLAECRKLGGCDTGDAKLTQGYNLPAQRVAHTVGPVYSRTQSEKSARHLKGCYQKCLELCRDNGGTSIAFPSISCGVYGYPIRDATSIALETVRKALDSPSYSAIERVIFVQFSKQDYDVYTELIPKYFPKGE